MKKIVIILLVISAILLTVIAFESQFFRLRKKANVTEKQKAELIKSAAAALQTLDVPIGALLLYKDSIISKGYNTVMRDTDVAAHAEIIAMNSAIKHLGFKAFNQLNRDSLILITTYEPCLMCRGALIENNIQNTIILKDKGLLHWLKNDVKLFRYELNKKQTDRSYLQDSLFELHPGYPAKKAIE